MSSSESGQADVGKPMAGREIVVGISGGIAAYKVCSVVSALVQQGAGVTCVMTESATRFVGPLTFQTLTGRKVMTSLWEAAESYDPNHLKPTESADLFLVAPATANIIAKTVHGLADDLLSTMLTSVTCPLVFAPAMNNRMWANKAVQTNVDKLRSLGCTIIEPGEGWLACGVVGQGRMEEPQRIVDVVLHTLNGVN